MVDDEPAPVAEWLPELAQTLGQQGRQPAGRSAVVAVSVLLATTVPGGVPPFGPSR